MSESAARSAGGQRGLSREWVIDQATYDLETERVFSKSWLYICRETELGSSECRRISVDGNRLFLIRDENRSIGCFRNFCRHRGSELVTDENCGTIVERIQCPYHAWTYGRDGKLLSAAPNMNDVEGFDTAQHDLISVKCDSWNGFVFVCLRNAGPSLAEFLGPLKQHAESWSFSELRVAEELCYEVNANWKLLFQNYSECYHCPTVHPALNRLTPYKGSHNDLERGAILGGPMQLSPNSETMSCDGHAVGKILPMLDQRQRRSVAYYTIFPTMFLSAHPDYVLVHRLERNGPHETRVVCQFLFHPDVFDHPGFNPASAVEFWDSTNKQDWQVCELVQRGMSDLGYVPGPYSNLESMVAEFDRYYREQMGF